MKNRPILITGCQRTGTTLLHLVLDSHPDIVGIDEMEFNHGQLMHYLNHARYHPSISFKLPIYAHLVSSMQQLSGLKVLWCLRDPRAVVASMIRLQLRIDENVSVPWASHPLGAHREIFNCFPVLSSKVQRKLNSFVRKYEEICRMHPVQRSHDDVVYAAALCWRVKNELLFVYKRKKAFFKTVFYERLIRHPDEEIQAILQFLNLPWHDSLLQHHVHHSGIAVGNTDKTRPIDSSSMEKWKTELSPTQFSIVRELCLGVAIKLGYELEE